MNQNRPAAEAEIGLGLIQTLITEFAPHLSEEEITPVGSGWDNEIHRIGDDMAIRLPRRAVAAPLIENEQQWLPTIAANLPVPVPVPVFSGTGAFGYPWAWSIVPWIEGIDASHADPGSIDALVDDLGEFLSALHVQAPAGAPTNPHRGIPLAERTPAFLALLERNPDADKAKLAALWDEQVGTPEWGGADVWLHGDLHPMNILVRARRLSGVIDFGDVCCGDPAVDLAVAWMLFNTEQREQFRRACAVEGKSIDIHTWNRARAWAMNHAVAVLAYSADDPSMARMARTTLNRVVEDLT